MSDCKYCDEEFSSKKEKLEHEIEEHGDEMSGHDKEEKKSELNKLQQQEQTSKHKKRRKIQYTAIGVKLLGLIGSGGFYAVNNLGIGGGPEFTNETLGIGTPVHWHADYQLEVCGQDEILRGGPLTAHTHGEKTFHMEGVRQDGEEATLDGIVDSLGGQLEEDSIMGKDGCDGEPANLTVEANGEEVEDHLDYIPMDGDSIRIIYG